MRLEAWTWIVARPSGRMMRSMDGWVPGPRNAFTLGAGHGADSATRASRRRSSRVEGSVDLPAPPHQHGGAEDHGDGYQGEQAAKAGEQERPKLLHAPLVPAGVRLLQQMRTATAFPQGASRRTRPDTARPIRGRKPK